MNANKVEIVETELSNEEWMAIEEREKEWNEYLDAISKLSAAAKSALRAEAMTAYDMAAPFGDAMVNGRLMTASKILAVIGTCGRQ